MREHAEGPRKTTGWTGRVRKAREGLSRPVLIGRAACPLRPPPCRADGAAGGEDMKLSLRDAPSGRAPAPLLRLSSCFLSFPAADFWPVALAGLSHPFPSRTRTLRAPAAMVLRPGAWESSAPPVFFSRPPASSRGWGPFSVPRGAGPARLHGFMLGAGPARLHALCSGLRPRGFIFLVMEKTVIMILK